MYYKLYFETEEKAKTFIDEINGLGYEWNPVRLYRPKTGMYQDSWCIKFDATAESFRKIEKAYFVE